MMSAPGFKQPRALQRQQAEQRRGRVAAGIRQQARRLDRVELEFGQSVRDALRQRCRRRIELRALRVVTQTERAGQIDDAHAARRAASARARRRPPRAAPGTRRRPRSAAAFSGTTVPSQIFESDGKPARRAGRLRAGGCGDRDVGMAREQTDQFLPREAGGAGHGHANGPLFAPQVPFRFSHYFRIHRVSVPMSSMALRKTMRPEE